MTGIRSSDTDQYTSRAVPTSVESAKAAINGNGARWLAVRTDFRNSIGAQGRPSRCRMNRRPKRGAKNHWQFLVCRFGSGSDVWHAASIIHIRDYSVFIALEAT